MNLQEKTESFIDEIPNINTSQLYTWSFEKLQTYNFSEQAAHLLNSFIWLIILAIVLFIIDWLTNNLLIGFITRVIKKTKTNWDDFFIQNKTLQYIGRYIPLSATKYLAPIVFMGFPKWTSTIVAIVNILMVITMLMIIRSILKTVRDILRTRPAFADKPLDSYLQVTDIFLLFVGGTIIFSIITGNSPWAFLASLGAASAILMLIFKDTILGFVASVQVSANDSVRVGDWIEMPKHGADGDVIEINLNNIKVQNWDKTITTIPTYLLLSDSFKNWRGMQRSGGRRIKRAIHIKISSIRFLNEEEINQLMKIELLSAYIQTRKDDILKYNQDKATDQSILVNGRRMTNVGLFRAYIDSYAKNNPRINQNMTIMVRQLASTEKGLPIELYMFTSDIRWIYFEEVMSDIFDHLFAAIKYFHLEVFESPASDDIRSLKINLPATENNDKG